MLGSSSQHLSRTGHNAKRCLELRKKAICVNATAAPAWAPTEEREGPELRGWSLGAPLPAKGEKTSRFYPRYLSRRSHERSDARLAHVI